MTASAVPHADRSADRAGAIVRSEREKRGLSLAQLAAEASMSRANVSRIERGRGGATMDAADRLLAAMGMRLHLEVEPLWDVIDAAIASTAGQPLTALVKDWPADLAAYVSFFDGIPFVIDGLAAAALQGAPVPVDALAVAVAASDDHALDELSRTLDAMGARRGDGYEELDPRVAGSPHYRSAHGPLDIRLTETFGQPLWLDIDPLPEPFLPLIDFYKSDSRPPLARARVAVTPITAIELSDARMARMLQRTRERVSSRTSPAPREAPAPKDDPARAARRG